MKRVYYLDYPFWGAWRVARLWQGQNMRKSFDEHGLWAFVIDATALVEGRPS